MYRQGGKVQRDMLTYSGCKVGSELRFNPSGFPTRPCVFAFLSSVISKIMDLLAQEIFFENHCITLCYLPKSDNEEQWAKMALIMWAILTSKFDTMKNMSMLRVMKFTLIVVKYRWKKSVSHSCPAQKKKNLIFLLLLSLIFVWTDCFQTKFPLYFLRGRKALLCHHPS